MTATKKKTTARKNKKEKTNSTLSYEVRGFIMLFAGAFMMYCVLFTGAGVIGTFVADILLRLFGKAGRVILACSVILNGALLLLGKRGIGAYVYMLAANLIVGLSLSVTTFDAYKLADKMLYYDLWGKDSRAGFMGGLLTKVLKDMFSSLGVWLIIICLSIIAFILIFKKSFVGSVSDKAAKAKQELHARREEEKARSLQEEEKRAPINNAKTVLETSDGSKLVFIEADKKRRARKNSSRQIPPPAQQTQTGQLPKINEGFMNLSDSFEAKKIIASEKASPAAAEEGFGVDNISLSTPSERKKRKQIKSSTHTPAEDKPEIGHETASEDILAAKSLKDKKELIYEQTEPKERTAANARKDNDTYIFPPYNMLDYSYSQTKSNDKKEVYKDAEHLKKVLADFGIDATVSEISMGPTITRFELQLKPGIRVSKVVSLSDDIALALAAKSVRIEAPIPGKSAIGIEVPNKEIQTVRLAHVIKAPEFTKNKSPLAVALGKKLSGEILVMDITKMPHLLIAGATGSGKSVCINTIIMSVIYHSSPQDVRMILIDPKMVELNGYNGMPHLLIPVVTNPKEASGALGWAVRQMTERYELFAEARVKDIKGYNDKALAEGNEKMPHVMLIIDELSDLMLVSPQQVETSICRLAQLARAAGIHLVLATQRPSVNVITGLIKANIPSRISFAVSSQIDSRTILDMGGAEKLLGKGDMLYYPTGESQPMRAQCAFVSETEVEKVVDFIKTKHDAEYDDNVLEEIKANAASDEKHIAVEDEGDDEYLIKKAMEIAYNNKGKISTSMIQRKLRLGYSRAGRIVDEMEDRGYISPADGSKPRELLINYEEYMSGESRE